MNTIAADRVAPDKGGSAPSFRRDLEMRAPAECMEMPTDERDEEHRQLDKLIAESTGDYWDKVVDELKLPKVDAPNWRNYTSLAETQYLTLPKIATEWAKGGDVDERQILQSLWSAYWRGEFGGDDKSELFLALEGEPNNLRRPARLYWLYDIASEGLSGIERRFQYLKDGEEGMLSSDYEMIGGVRPEKYPTMLAKAVLRREALIAWCERTGRKPPTFWRHRQLLVIPPPIPEAAQEKPAALAEPAAAPAAQDNNGSEQSPAPARRGAGGRPPGKWFRRAERAMEARARGDSGRVLAEWPEDQLCAFIRREAAQWPKDEQPPPDRRSFKKGCNDARAKVLADIDAHDRR